MLQKAPKLVKDYYESGADKEVTLLHNISYLKTINLIPRIFMGGKPDALILNRSIFEKDVSPIGIAPFASQAAVHPSGEIATAKAAQSVNAIMILSTYSTVPMEQVKTNAKHLWLQLYIFEDFRLIVDLIKRAEKCGIEALVLTVDRPRLGKRRCNIQIGTNCPLT